MSSIVQLDRILMKAGGKVEVPLLPRHDASDRAESSLDHPVDVAVCQDPRNPLQRLGTPRSPVPEWSSRCGESRRSPHAPRWTRCEIERYGQPMLFKGEIWEDSRSATALPGESSGGTKEPRDDSAIACSSVASRVLEPLGDDVSDDSRDQIAIGSAAQIATRQSGGDKPLDRGNPRRLRIGKRCEQFDADPVGKRRETHEE